MTSNDKYCGGCRVAKPKTEFNKRAASKDGLAYRCRTCTKRYAEKHREKYPLTADKLAEQRVYNLMYRSQNREKINETRKKARTEVKRIERIRRLYAEKESTNCHRTA